MPAIATARDTALRALAEGAAPTLPLLADLSGRSLPALEKQAARENWRLGGAGERDFSARVRPLIENLVARVEALVAEAAEGDGRIERTELDGIVATIRALEKIGEYARPQEAAGQNPKGQDEDLATVLERINDRIIAFARELAARMAAETRGLDRDAVAEGRVAGTGAAAAISAAS